MRMTRKDLMAALSLSFAWLMIITGNQPSIAIALSISDDDACTEQQCSPEGPAVRFPFVLLGKQPQHCGYNSSFNLHCDQLNRTILELPSSSIKVEVISISYIYHMIDVRPVETCFVKHLRDLDISTTPFSYPTQNEYYLFKSHTPDFYNENVRYHYNDYMVVQYSLFNCSTFNLPSSSRAQGFESVINISCLGNDGFNVHAIQSYKQILDVAGLMESCTKMYDSQLVPVQIFEGDFFKMIWFVPCPVCEMQSGIGSGSNYDAGYKHLSETLKKLLIYGPIIGCLVILLAATAIYLAITKKKLNKEDHLVRLKKFLEDYAAMKPTRYSYADIRKITNDFKDKLGEGGYGNVYKGKVSNNIFVAVKVLHSSTENGEEFINEVGTMGRIHHVNVVRMLGFCADGYKKALVFEFLPNGSLDKNIFPDGQEQHTLGMERLQDIAIGIARGIEYLHQGCEQRILHFDIKPHNILLDENYNPKISDFGLAKLCEKGKSAVSMTAARGTMGYIAPEVFSRQFGNVSYKSDIYSFGMLLLEMVGRRKNTDSNVQNISQVYFPEWIYGRLVNGEEFRIQVEDEENGEDQIAKKLAIVGLWCIQWNPANRPSITLVLQMLEGIAENLILPPNPFASGNEVNPADPSKKHTRLTFNSTLTVISESH